MKTIKFSHKYKKMPHHCKNARLLEVLNTTKEELSEEFIEYDTVTLKGDNYPLPDGKLIVLLLWCNDELWTTIRRYTLEKDRYYKSMRGEIFKIEVTG